MAVLTTDGRPGWGQPSCSFCSSCFSSHGRAARVLIEKITGAQSACTARFALHVCSLVPLDRRRLSRQGMDGRYYHHYTSSDRMWYMPEHPGPYPAPVEPPSLEQLEIAPPTAEPPLCPVAGEVSQTVGLQAVFMHIRMSHTS